MVTQRTEGLYRVFLFCQIIIVAALFWFGVWIMVTFYSEGGALTWGRYSIYCGMLVLGLILETLSRSKNFFLQNELLRPHRLSLRQTAASVGLLVLYLVAAKDAFISRLFLFHFVPWLYIALLFSHYYLPSLLARGIFRREDKTILVGSSQRVAQLREWLERKAEIGLRTVGLISDDDQIDNPEVPLLGRPDQLEQIIRDHGITQIILLEFPLFSEANQNVIQICDQLGIRLLILSDLEERLRHSVTHFEDGGFRFIGLREEPLENPLNRFLKRAIDLAIALPVMLIVFPVLTLVVFVAQRLQSPGAHFRETGNHRAGAGPRFPRRSTQQRRHRKSRRVRYRISGKLEPLTRVRDHPAHLRAPGSAAAQRLLAFLLPGCNLTLPEPPHFRANQLFVPAHARAVFKSFTPFEKAAFQNVHVKKTQKWPAGNPTEDRFQGAIST